MNRYKLVWAGCLLTLAIIIAVVALRSPKPAALQASSQSKADIKLVPGAKESKKSRSKKDRLTGDSSANGAESFRGQAVEMWEKQLDDVIASANLSAAEMGRRVKEVFDRLDKADQMDCIQRGLNLLPDERFAVLYDILYDKSEDPDVLDAIFSDALNRPEGIKMPILRALRKDREHPMFFESARILDVVDPEKKKTPQR